MKDLVTKNIGNYFGKRARISGLVALICMIIAGFILDYFKQTKVFIGFIILFSIAFIGRLVSSLLVKKQYEPEFKEDERAYFSIFEFVKKMAYNNFGRFVLYFALVSLTTCIASPLFTVYMLKNLNFSYTFYMLTILSSSITTLIAMPLWGRFADKYGNLKVMRLTGVFVPIIPFLWLFSVLLIPFNKTIILIYIMLIQAASGIAWAGFNLCAGNFIYDAVSRQRMAICVSYFNVINGFGILVGALLGGYISSIKFNFWGLTPLYFIFILSGLARAGVYFFMKDKIQEVREVKQINVKSEIKNKIQKDISKIFNSISLKKFSESIESSLKFAPL